MATISRMGRTNSCVEGPSGNMMRFDQRGGYWFSCRGRFEGKGCGCELGFNASTGRFQTMRRFRVGMHRPAARFPPGTR